jgi:hypothetical protein
MLEEEFGCSLGHSIRSAPSETVIRGDALSEAIDVLAPSGSPLTATIHKTVYNIYNQ